MRDFITFGITNVPKSKTDLDPSRGFYFARSDVHIVHIIAKFFTTNAGTPNKNAGERIMRLQKVVFLLWQVCAENNLAFVASCRPAQKRIVEFQSLKAGNT